MLKYERRIRKRNISWETKQRQPIKDTGY